jgi:membrane-associated protein
VTFPRNAAGSGTHLPALNPLDSTSLLGAQSGYWIGRTGGRALLGSGRHRNLIAAAARAGELLTKYGHGKAIVLARFIPVVRTVLNPMAGALHVPSAVFTRWQAIGGLAWTFGVTLAGYALGSSIPGIDTYLLPIIALIVIISLLPIALERRRAHRAASHSPTVPARPEEPSQGPAA